MIKNDKFEEIGLMFDMFSRVNDALLLLKNHLQKYIIEEGNKLVMDDKLK